jgi:hypothetical protein
VSFGAGAGHCPRCYLPLYLGASAWLRHVLFLSGKSVALVGFFIIPAPGAEGSNAGRMRAIDTVLPPRVLMVPFAFIIRKNLFPKQEKNLSFT